MWIGAAVIADSGVSDHMSWTGMGGMLFWGFMFVLVLLLATVVGSRIGRTGDIQARGALEVLETRFASGEIDEEEFIRRRALLDRGRPDSD